MLSSIFSVRFSCFHAYSSSFLIDSIVSETSHWNMYQIEIFYASKGNWFQGYLITISSTSPILCSLPEPERNLCFLPLYSIFNPDIDDTQGKYLHFLTIALFGQRRPVLPKLLQNVVGKFSGEESFYCNVFQQSSILFEIFKTNYRSTLKRFFILT